MSTEIFDALPGVETPVSQVRSALAAVWEWEPMPGVEPPSEFRASQMNLILHFGLESTVASAREAFETALRLSRRYPCRIITLCPRSPGSGGGVTAKIYCECFVGQSRDDMVCSEAIIISFPLEQRPYLENQASIMLESDLPLYYWPQRIQRASRLRDYPFFLREARRIVIDSALEKEELTSFAWPRPEALRDLAWGRVLPVRQTLGHFLSYIPPERVVRGLERVAVQAVEMYAAEARVLAQWMRNGVLACAQRAGGGEVSAAFAATTVTADALRGDSIHAEWRYRDGAHLDFRFNFETGAAHLESTLDCEAHQVSAHVRLLTPENALAEALFF